MACKQRFPSSRLGNLDPRHPKKEGGSRDSIVQLGGGTKEMFPLDRYEEARSSPRAKC